MPEQNATATAPTTEAPKPVTKVESKLSFRPKEFKEKVPVVIDGKKQRDNEDKVVYRDEAYTVMNPVAPGANEGMLDGPAGFVAGFNTIFAEANTQLGPNWFSEFIEDRKIVDWLYHLTQVAEVTNAKGEKFIDPAKLKNALFLGAPRSVNTLNSVKAQLAEVKQRYADLSMIGAEYKDDQAKLAAAAKDLGYETLAAFGTALTEAFMRIRNLTAQLKAIEAKKAENDAKKKAEALAAPAAPVK